MSIILWTVVWKVVSRETMGCHRRRVTYLRVHHHLLTVGEDSGVCFLMTVLIKDRRRYIRFEYTAYHIRSSGGRVTGCALTQRQLPARIERS